MSTDVGADTIAPEEFVQPDCRLFIDTNVFMDTREGRAAGLKQLFEQCKDIAVRSGNGIVVPTKVVDELTKQSRLDTAEFTDERAAAVRRAGLWLPALESGASAGLIRKDLGDGSNPYADDLFVDLFTRFGGKYSMCLLTEDITLRLRIRLLAERTDRRLVAGTVSLDGRIEVESDQALYGRGVRKLARIRQRIDEGTGPSKDRKEVAILTPVLDDFQKTFGVEAVPPPPGNSHTPPVAHLADPAGQRTPAAFKSTTTLRSDDQLLGETDIPDEGAHVTAESLVGRRSLVLGELLGEGGEGRVFAVDGDEDLVVKIFDEEHRTGHRVEKVRLLMSHDLVSPGIAFPASVITNGDGEDVGYAMPRASGKVLQATIMRPARFKATYPNWTKADLVDVCISFLEKVEYLHSLNILVGDINPKNLLVTEGKEVWIIDADSWQFEGYPCPVGTPMFTAPTITGEYADALRTMEEELFAVATMLFMILITGAFPYARAGADTGDVAGLIKEGKFAFQFREHSDRDQPDGPWKFMWSHLPPQVKARFWNTFHRDGRRYNRRPTANEWLRAFREYQQFLSGPENFDDMSNDVFPTRYKAGTRDTPIYECATCHTSMVGMRKKGQREFSKPPLCRKCDTLDPSRLCGDCGQPFITFNHAHWHTSNGREIPTRHEWIKEQCPPKGSDTTRRPNPKDSGIQFSPGPTASKTPSPTAKPQRVAALGRSVWAKVVDWWK